MTGHDYQIAALRTAEHMDADDMLINGVLGLAGEVGECVDLVKKHLYQGHPLDTDHLAKELSDVSWYLATTAAAIGFDLDTVFQMNVDKLLKRYPNGFEPSMSMNRKAGDV